MSDAKGKIAVVTGGTSGIGQAIAEGLAQAGATVVLLARDPGRAEATTQRIRSRTPGASVASVAVDLASQTSIRTAAAQLLERYPRVDILVLAAGVFHKSRSETPEGIESTFAVNYLANFLLTNLLKDALVRGAPSRVVLIASRYGGAKIDFDDLMVKQRKFTIMNSVPPTKLAEVLLAQELAERWAGSGVLVNAVHPGLVARTHLLEEVGGMWKWLTNTFGGSPEKGADTPIWLATSPDASQISGKLVAKRHPIPTPGQGSDPVARRRLWDVSVQMTKL